jgi:polyisoprenoid-binding protein YceI
VITRYAPLAVALSLLLPLPVPAFAATTGTDTLIVFTQTGKSDIARRFEAESLTSITLAAEKLGIRAVTLDASKGAPAEVTVTPLLVFQNHRGRSIFQGRYADMGKVRHFLRTSRSVPQGEAPIVHDDVAMVTDGRARIVVKLKITGLEGDKPAGFDQSDFEKRARAAAMAALAGFKPEARVDLGRADRTFYLDLYPYRSADGKLFVTPAVYSQFNCHEPVYSGSGKAIEGKWSDYGAAFTAAARAMAEEVHRQIRESKLGDGFDPVPASAPAVTWESLGLALPPAAPASSRESVTTATLANRWVVEQPADPDAAPILQFKFPAPLDNYTGTARDVSGELVLGDGFALQGAKGSVRVAVASVTMGEPGLDDTVRKAVSLNAFPDARFELGNAVGDTAPLVFGKMGQILAIGTFTMKGIQIPLEVRAEIEPVVADDGGARLAVTASFNIRLKKPFGIDGPDGPAPANDTLEFFLSFIMAPAK